ncbi:TrkH family potassium uptake protein [Treponema phagedenis]|uniref:TrkH family potassium uptake protein n=2 Tax=Treponema phagedenis TaxID=162 RepID=A0AAE6ISH1_TREPH|nr:TrkH family potassium uptake protein [Treponema phagedenis]NVP23739.1 TrkH family potassium uptake protein [Treponema phagedenis]QEJ94441.1 TrkH family potassium uptake protein [Treponema phagedenis]QEJ97505.1 TrkH family potassium uptake protein [Treponema phagedenis]QEK01678.1 TrkH family potassium uptake protein [Treponema phagedenis]QEK03075.1 TrkH family potassium uptake protein [Treponema phagedenis]
MKVSHYIKILFMILAIVALSFLIPIAVALYLKEYHLIPSFLIPMCVVCGIAAILFFKDFFTDQRKQLRLSTQGGIALVALAWIGACLLGAVPFLISGVIPEFADALFESVSGFTTTGSTILLDVDSCPMTMHIWRTQMHWLGGMGIVALTVALFPLLGVGGFHLIKSETTGPDKGKVTSKITQTAKALWFIYLGLTLLQIILLIIAGMSFLDSVCYSFATLGTGGFSTKNASLGAYNSPAADIIITVFMFLAGVNFSLYFRLFTGHIGEVAKNSELRSYVWIVLISSLLIAFSIYPIYGMGNSLRHSFFQVVSIITTTGFATVNFDLWPEFAKSILFLLMFIGGCSGSTAGGIKVIRWVILKKQAANEIKRLLYPHGVFSIQLNKRPGRKDVVYSVAGFIFLYFMLLLATFLVASMDKANTFTALTAALALVGNIGPGFDLVGPAGNFAFFSAPAKIFFSFSMLAGRLELYTMLLFFYPLVAKIKSL